MKIGFWLVACVAAKGCGRKCTNTWFNDTIQCSETATTAKEFAACFFKSGDAYVKCLEACDPDPCVKKCGDTFNAAEAKCEALPTPQEQVKCERDAIQAFRACRQACPDNPNY